MLVAHNHDEIIKKSHKRCIDYGVEKERIFPITILKGKEFNLILEKNNDLIKIARPFMEILYDFLKGSGFSLYLTDKDGFVLTIIGDEDIIRDQAKMGIVVGADMSEKSTGTNAIGTALHEDCSFQISGEEHFINAYHVWTCSAATIHSEDGDIVGCLNLTGRRQLAHPHTLGLVVAAVKSIENQMKVEKAQNELFRAYQYLNKIINSINSGIFAVDTNGLVKAINNSACKMLEVREEDVINRNVENVLDNWKYIFDQLKIGNDYENKEIIYSGGEKKKRFNLNMYPIKNQKGTITGMVGILNYIQNVYNLVNKYTGMRATYTFDDIIGKSKEILKIKEQARSIANSPSTVLIQGESGTGKELIAQSIHNSSNRKNNSFVAINCGAIPKSLIESELFGYEEGAFTGAKRGGHPGKFELANGGTLFLDEIGEMPLDMQVNLLRVLQEGCVTRVGGNKYINIDVRIIAATNKDLKKEVEKGTFREDLYYRLSVIPIYVPPLRERKEDIEILMEHFLKVKAIKLGKPIPKIRHDIYEKIINYNWPGNVREMENCIENIVNLDGNTSFNFKIEGLSKEQSNSSEKILEYDMCSLEQWELKAIKSCIDKCNGNITKASRILGINRSTLYSKLKKYNIG
ncbi:sigma-54-dependent Fis family transcriptional regulator [Clostridium prolinivorans]|jgi:PAS domain S-box-containing protein|uniref:sigma-54-dependent Fis family transcriptional regulator n=1 Tax=Clostridium prolinivorans TaxID=2769420 RepID=UPI000FDBDD2C|nr:sigma 54-interacting transcriptional regulator [Clostridium prolinivorans]